jgi:hypothetical protein
VGRAARRGWVQRELLCQQRKDDAYVMGAYQDFIVVEIGGVNLIKA